MKEYSIVVVTLQGLLFSPNDSIHIHTGVAVRINPSERKYIIMLRQSHSYYTIHNEIGFSLLLFSCFLIPSVPVVAYACIFTVF